MMQRRSLLAAWGLAPVLGAAASAAWARPAGLPAQARWLVGIWRSDVERSMAHFTFQGRAVSESARPQVAALFGKISHTFTQTHLYVDTLVNGQTHHEGGAYRVVGHTDNSVSLDLPALGWPGFTVYRDGEWYFVRSGENREYFKRLA